MIRFFLTALVAIIFSASASLAGPVAGPMNTGNPGIKGIDAITFAPDGILLISDGQASQIVAVQTGDTQPVKGEGPHVSNIIHEIAGRLGTADKSVEIACVVVNPASGRVYLLVKNLEAKANLILKVESSGEIAPLALGSVPFTTVKLPASDAGSPRVTEMSWAGDRLVCSARTGEEFAAKVLVIPAPLGPSAAGAMISAETYHVSHKRWETKAPLTAIFPFEENGKKYIVGGLGCTPIVKYPVEGITNNAKVKGESMLELGSGNRPINMFSYTKNGKVSVIVNTFRFHHAKAPISPSPYWTCRFDQSILAADNKVNENATHRDVKKPDDAAITMVTAFHGVMNMAKLDDNRAVVVRDNNGRVDLEVLPLP
jgi:hypothetical protein